MFHFIVLCLLVVFVAVVFGPCSFVGEISK